MTRFMSSQNSTRCCCGGGDVEAERPVGTRLSLIRGEMIVAWTKLVMHPNFFWELPTLASFDPGQIINRGIYLLLPTTVMGAQKW
ncbi:hypothetical protein CapIbe_009678 [Capra ibex]